MTLADFFWLDEEDFAAHLKALKDDQLLFQDKHNIRKRKGGKGSAIAGTIQAPFTLGVSFIGVGIGLRNRHVAKKRLEMIHAEIKRRGLEPHAENWKDDAVAAIAVGAGVAIGQCFVPATEAVTQRLVEAGALQAAQSLVEATATVAQQNFGQEITQIATSKITDPDWYDDDHKKA